ncbi:O-antigen ligase domain-containing protein [Pontibacter sp. E15-1]|uniref:O-antigen ligase family protein n=1 Tax=Pontibacter sp. E15-1 TaxID=2919918 RepID=UPI001F503BBD|nr:O-antigen ligase family protein [Pontibacter sp. E15-1]MCJ8163618.1 O-antigen ligase domain-containing protein [Pontibacter sp. E15-1]
MKSLTNTSYSPLHTLYLLAGIGAAVCVGWLTANMGILVPAFLILAAITLPSFIAVFHQPRVGLVVLVVYTFLVFVLSRELGGFPFGLGMDAILMVTWIAVIFNHRRYDWGKVKNDLCYLAYAWFILNILELGNPAGASVQGWLQEIRSSALYWVMLVPLCFLLFDQKRYLNLFLYLIIALSVLGTLNGFKQLYIGLSPGEQAFLDEGSAKTHIIWGKLRAFSFYSDAAQFGASQAHLALIALVLAFGPFRWWHRLTLAAASGVLLSGMLISGTRGALFVVLTGVVVALLLSRNLKVLLLGFAMAFSGFYVLKYTTIGNSNYNIMRMRTALDPKDASLNVRLSNQLILRDYLRDRPFGGGVGVIGNWGVKYNSDKFLSSIPPDSYWVKVWAMYGIVGFVIWFGMMMFILGKCCGIVWNIQNKALKVKLIALTAGAAGVLFSSYGNEIINGTPTAIIVYISWAFVFMAPQFDSYRLSTKALVPYA